ncbi:MAG TPA: sigma factor-like helix-turn-helix DNA-binding protein, partial [Mycobacteriales bacterium]|nr:sigma factor-like helix-turn-helix DNA-binding protein [Mycobacteriales bacterium]
AALRAEDRDLLLEHEVEGVEVRKLAAEHGVPAGTVAARLARARARLRVEHLLALRRVTLPTARCRGVLDALSLGDRARQRTLRAAEHLMGCATCAGLAEPLLQRRRSLTALAPVAVLLALPGRVAAWIRANPVPATASGAVAVATAVVVAVVTHGSPPPAPVAAPPPATSRASSPATLTVGGVPVLPAARVGPMTADVGRPAEARDVPVQSVPADEGFWVGGGPGARVWVELDAHGTESAVRVRPGQRATFTGRMVAVTAGTPARLGLTDPAAAAELRSAGAYLEVDARRLVLR